MLRISPARRRRAARGYALIEVLVALAIVVAIGTLSYVAFAGSGDRARVQAEAEAIGLVLQQARMRALERGAPVEIALADGVLVAGPARHVVPEGTALEPEHARLTLRPSGESAGLDLMLRRGTARAAVRLDWLTGRVVVE